MMKEYKKFKLYWGDFHTNIHGKDLFYPPLTYKRLRKIMKAAESHLDFFPIAYYPFKWYRKKGFIIESCGSKDRFLKDWKLIQKVVAEFNKPGKFVTFLGYEWHGNRRIYGDHNVYYLKDYETLDGSEDIRKLYENLRRTTAIVIPHHTGYKVGERGKDWNFYDENLSPFVEIYSSHGSSEGFNSPLSLDNNLRMGPRVTGGTVQEGLNRGYKFGIIASGDNHRDFPGEWGNGLAAVFAHELTREALWDAFKKRRVYGVTGDRIKLYFTINGHIMGESFEENRPININVEVEGSYAIDRVEIIKNGRVFYTYCHSGKWDFPKNMGNNVVRAKIRLQCGWGPGPPYRFKEYKKKVWKGSLQLSNGKIISIEPCFTYFGQQIKQTSFKSCEFIFTNQPNVPLKHLLPHHHRINFQGAIIELETHMDDKILLNVNSLKITFTLEEALNSEMVIALTKEAKATIHKQFGLRPNEIENPDIYWHNAWKMKIYRAIPFEGYHAKFKCVDENLNVGEENYYYVRVTQLNCQMAWSSPIWVKVNQ